MSSPTSPLNVDVRPGKLPILRAEANGTADRWAAEHRDALRAVVSEHGSLLVRGLGLREVAQTDAVFRRLGSLMDETEAFAPRQRYAQGVYSPSKWPPNQPMSFQGPRQVVVAMADPVRLADASPKITMTAS